MPIAGDIRDDTNIYITRQIHNDESTSAIAGPGQGQGQLQLQASVTAQEEVHVAAHYDSDVIMSASAKANANAIVSHDDNSNLGVDDFYVNDLKSNKRGGLGIKAHKLLSVVPNVKFFRMGQTAHKASCAIHSIFFAVNYAQGTYTTRAVSPYTNPNTYTQCIYVCVYIPCNKCYWLIGCTIILFAVNRSIHMYN
jgi:hypothetical protein